MLSRKALKKKLNISTDYLIISILIVSGIIISSGISIFFTYKNNANNNQRKLQKEINIVQNTILEELTEHSWYVRSLANKIKSKSDLTNINQIISYQNKSNVNFNLNQPSNQKNLYWVDANDNILIKNRVGILDTPKKFSPNYITNKSKHNPWQLIISDKLPYFENDYNLILTSFGITQNDGQYIGSIVSFIDANFIQNLLINNISQENNFVILNPKNQKIVFQSNQKNFIADTNFFVGKIGKEIDLTKNQNAYIKQDIFYGDFKYNQYQKLGGYPLIIITGYNHKIYQAELLKSLIKSTLPSVGIGLLLLTILLLFYRRTIKPIRDLCEVARTIGYSNCGSCKVPRNINCPEIYDLTKALLKIKYQKISINKNHQKLTDSKKQLEEAIEIARKSDIAQIEIVKQIRTEITKNASRVFQNLNILKYNINNGNAFLNNQINLHLIDNITQEINNITKFATDELNKDHIDIKYIIDRVLLSQEKEIRNRNIILKINYEANLPKKVFVDQIRLIQILSSLLNKTIKLLIDGTQINIFIKSITKNKNKHLAIKIEDNGIGIGIKEHLETTKKLGGSEEAAISGIDISINTIEELVQLHGGEILYENQIHKGSSTTILIPIMTKERKKKPIATQDNILYLPTKMPISK
jgi:hypothetical protein